MDWDATKARETYECSNQRNGNFVLILLAVLLLERLFSCIMEPPLGSPSRQYKEHRRIPRGAAAPSSRS